MNVIHTQTNNFILKMLGNQNRNIKKRDREKKTPYL